MKAWFSLMALVVLGVACGEKEQTEKPRSPKLSSTYACDERTDDYNITVFRSTFFHDVLCRRALADVKIFGKSLRSAFRLREGDFPTVEIQEAFSETSWERTKKFRESRERDGTKVLSLPPEGRFKNIMDGTLDVFKRRCPAYFGRKTQWQPSKLEWDYTGVGGSGRFRQMYHGGYKRGFSDSQADLAIVMLSRTDGQEKNRNRTTWEVEGRIADDVSSDIESYSGLNYFPMGLTNYLRESYEDNILAHELGHWTFDQWAWENGNLPIQTMYFAESFASWVGALCYFSPLENESVRKIVWQWDKQPNHFSDLDHSGNGKVWPLSDSYFDNWFNPPDQSNGRFSYEQYYGKIVSFGALYLAINEEYGEQDKQKLLDLTFRALSRMEGKKLQCLPSGWCAGMDERFSNEPMENRPHVHTMGEFALRMEEELKKEGLFPARAQAMWDLHKQFFERYEK